MTDLTPEVLKARWDELTATRGDYDALLDPLREELATLVQGTADISLSAAKAREEEVRALIVNYQNELFPIEQERGAISRALKWQTG